MELSKDLERIIKESVSTAIASQMKIHSDAVEKKISDRLELFTNRLDKIDEKIDKMEKKQATVNNKIDSLDGYINNIWKENAEIKKENEEILKRAKESQRKAEVAQAKIDDLEQYGRKAMIEVNGFPRLDEEDPWKLTLDLAEKLNVSVSENEIEACHRISGNEKAGIIVEFASRRKRDEFLVAKKKLSGISTKDFGFEVSKKGEGRIFINESLTAKRKMLIRDLKSKKEEFNFKYVWSKKGTIFIRRDENSRAIRINSLDDLNKLDE